MLALRAMAAVSSAAAFGLLAAPGRGGRALLEAVALAFVFGVLFVGGTGWRILLAAARRDRLASAPASWTGASAAVTLGALVAGCAALAAGGAVAGVSAARLLAAAGVGLNLAYALVKLGCLEAGCCHAAPRSAFAATGIDLRLAEIALTLLTLAPAGALIALGHASGAALAGFGGHLALRLISRRARERWPRAVLTSAGRGQEVPLLVAATVLAALVASS